MSYLDHRKYLQWLGKSCGAKLLLSLVQVKTRTGQVSKRCVLCAMLFEVKPLSGLSIYQYTQNVGGRLKVIEVSLIETSINICVEKYGRVSSLQDLLPFPLPVTLQRNYRGRNVHCVSQHFASLIGFVASLFVSIIAALDHFSTKGNHSGLFGDNKLPYTL